MKAVYLDTDILLDFILDRQPHNQHAQRLFAAADAGKVELLVSALSFANANYVLRKFIDDKEKKEILSQIMSFVRICSLTASELHQAMSLNFTDLEDAIQYATASNNNADLIITRNVKDYSKSLIPVLNPEIFMSTEDFE
jgi:predicted nucleic acid-binding protein